MSDKAHGPLSFPLRDGGALPSVGLGTYQVKGEAGYHAVLEALKIGYRHIDTAAGYRNEKQVGQAIRDSGVPREEVFLQSKLAPKDQGEGAAYQAVLDSIEALGVDYIDCYLMHWPGKSGLRPEDPTNREVRHQSYRDLQRACQEGKLRRIGVSNFNIRHLEGLLADPTVTIRPAINQVEVHPYYQQRDLRAFCAAQGILVQAYSSLGQMDPSLRQDRAVLKVAEEVGRTPAQVLLRWALQHGLPVIPKTTSPARMAENFGVLDFELDDGAMRRLDALEKGQKFAWNPELIV